MKSFLVSRELFCVRFLQRNCEQARIKINWDRFFNSPSITVHGDAGCPEGAKQDGHKHDAWGVP